MWPYGFLHFGRFFTFFFRGAEVIFIKLKYRYSCYQQTTQVLAILFCAIHCTVFNICTDWYKVSASFHSSVSIVFFFSFVYCRLRCVYVSSIMWYFSSSWQVIWSRGGNRSCARATSCEKESLVLGTYIVYVWFLFVMHTHSNDLIISNS